MSLALDDLIAAVATPAGAAARSVIRVSGSRVVELLALRFSEPQGATGGRSGPPVVLNVERRPALTSQSPRQCPPLLTVERNRTQQARRIPGLYHIEGWRTPVPVDLWLWPTSRSYTGQPSAELHLVGSPPVVEALLAQLFHDGARPARAGEFTLRAFLAGRVDLVQAEAVLGVIDATDHDQLKAALTQLAGGISKRIGEARESLLLDLADLEAGLDFVEEDIEFVKRPHMLARIRQTLSLVEELLQQGTDRMTGGPLPRVVLAGLPNAGKSTLFNQLAGSQRAIVSDLAGTTRDALRAEVEWNGFRLELVDTAGLDEFSTGIAGQAETIRREVIAAADLVLWCSSLRASDDVARDDEASDDEAQWRAVSREHQTALRIGTKRDEAANRTLNCIAVSAKTGAGMDMLCQVVCEHFQSRSSHHSEWLTSTAARSRDALERCVDNLRAAEDAAESHVGDELLSLELRAALEALGEVCGAVHTDDILDRIFSRFCIGK